MTTLQIANLFRDEDKEDERDISSGEDSDNSYKPDPVEASDGSTSDEDTQVCTGCHILIARSVLLSNYSRSGNNYGTPCMY